MLLCGSRREGEVAGEASKARGEDGPEKFEADQGVSGLLPTRASGGFLWGVGKKGRWKQKNKRRGRTLTPTIKKTTGKPK